VSFEAEIVRIKTVNVVFCRGRLQGEDADNFKTKVLERIPGSPCIVIQMRDLKRIDSRGVGVLVQLKNSAKAAGGDVKLATITDWSVRDVLGKTRMTPKVFEVYEDEKQAVASFGDQSAG
jgi:anti-anti-sigma factor